MGLFANRGVDGEGGCHIHRVAYGNPGDGMRAMNAPCEVVLFSSGEKFVLLGVIEILDIQTTQLFAERCLLEGCLYHRLRKGRGSVSGQ